jgi:hypothetical protein
MDTVWIIGAGRVGRRAVARLQARRGEARITLVDAACGALAGDWPDNVARVCADGVDFLSAHLAGETPPDPWIVPALPVHLAGAWVRQQLAAYGFEVQPAAIPADVQARLPNALPGPPGIVYCSQADFRCPDDCREGPVCPHTGRPRPPDLFRVLEALAPAGFQVTVLRSRQMAPGLGGYRAATLRQALAVVRRDPGRHLLATACKCHGVLEAFQTRAAPVRP